MCANMALQATPLQYTSFQQKGQSHRIAPTKTIYVSPNKQNGGSI
jgi:hypothetical protein